MPSCSAALHATPREELTTQDGFDTGTVESWLETNNILYERKYGKKA